MTFKELIDLYKSGKASDTQKKMVEDEVEKFEAVSDYVYSDRDDGELTITTYGVTPEQEESEKFSNTVRKQIRQSYLKLGAAIIIIVIAIIVVQTFLPSVVNKFYYDPSKGIAVAAEKEWEGGTYTETVQQINMDFAVYSQLHMPLEYRNDARAYPLGYGKYNISITQSMFYGDDYIQPAVGGQIIRDDLALIPPDFLDRSVLRGAFTYSAASYSEQLEDGTDVEIPLDKEYAQQNKDFLTDMKKLDKDQRVKAIISFKEPISYKKMVDITDKYELGSPWYAVETTSEGQFDLDFGFSSYNNREYEVYDNDKYPNLFSSNNGVESDEENKEKFFLSMISYMGDQKEFLKIFDPLFEYHIDMYENAYDFVKKNGLKIYGTVAYVNYDTAKRLIDDNIAYNVKFKDFGRQ